MRYKNRMALPAIIPMPVKLMHTIINRMGCMLLCISSAVALHAQKVDTSYTLLWYKGKKISDTSLFRPGGEIISYSPSQQTVTVTYPPGGDPHQSIQNEVARSSQTMARIDEAIAGPAGDQAPPALVVSTNQAIERAYDEITAALTNKIKIKPPPPINPTTLEKVEWLKTWPSDVTANYSAVLAYLSHPYSAAFATSVPPPDYSYDYCFPCDEARNKKYHDDSIAFINSFLSEEYLYMERASSVLDYLQKKPKLDSIAHIQSGRADSVLNQQARDNMFAAIQAIAKRIEVKVIGAWERYKSESVKIPFMVDLMLKSSRNHELMGFPTDSFPSFLEIGSTLLLTLKQVLDKAKQDKDYKILLNSKNMYFIYVAQNLGFSPEAYGFTIYDLARLWEFNLNIDARAKIESKELTESAELNYEGIYLAYSDSTCRLKWDRKGQEKITGLPFDLSQIALRAGKYTGAYTGTKKYGAKRPWIRLDFCDKKRDTADFYPFFPSEGEDSWNIPGLPVHGFQVVHRVFMATFMDEASLRKRAMSMNQSTMEEQVSTINQEQPKSMTPKDYERASQLRDIEDKNLQISWYNSLYYFPVRGQLKNFDQVVFDETLDGKKISKFPNTVYATFHVKIKHIE